jgi:hypothetical protein
VRGGSVHQRSREGGWWGRWIHPLYRDLSAKP